MKTKAQEWFLVKKNWIDWIEDLDMEQRGILLTALYTKQVPEGLLGTLVKSHMEEFDRVNEKREEGLAKRREASKKGNEIKYQSTPSGNPVEVDTTPSLSPTKTKTNTKIDTDTKRKISIRTNTYGSVEEFDKLFQ